MDGSGCSSGSMPVNVDRPPSMPSRSLSFEYIIKPLSRSRHEKIRSIKPQKRRGRRPRLTRRSFSTYKRPSIVVITAFASMIFVFFLSQSRIRSFNNDESRRNNPSTITYMSTGNATNDRIKGILEIVSSAADNAKGSNNKIPQPPPWPSYLSLHRLDRDNEPQTSKNVNIQSCIVTAYFKVKSKFDKSKYDEWMQNMLSMSDCMVIFCEEEMVPVMLQHRNNRKSPTAVIAMQLQDLPIASYFHPNHDKKGINSATMFWKHQLEIDPERKLHKSYQLFWIWLSKTWFVTTAAVLQNHFFQTIPNHRIEFWMWADIGSFRNRDYAGKQLIRYPHQVLQPNDQSTILWMAHHTPNPPSDPFWNQKLKKEEKKHYYHSGSHAAGSTVAAWIRFHERFVMTLDAYAERNLFLGEDQCVLQTTCLLYPDSCAYVPFNQVPDNHYFGLRYILNHGPQSIQNNSRLQPFQLWKPPTTWSKVT